MRSSVPKVCAGLYQNLHQVLPTTRLCGAIELFYSPLVKIDTTMRAFEIYLNGKKLCVAGVDLGDLLCSVSGGENKQGRGDIGLNVTGYLLTQETIRWQHRSLQMNDQILIKITEAKAVDKYEVLQKARRDSRKYEKAYVRRMAKEFGWTIQVKSIGQRKTSTGK